MAEGYDPERERVARLEMKKRRWAEAEQAVDRIADRMGKPIETAIKPTLVALWARGIGSDHSCEGHDDGIKTPFPWVRLAAPGKPEMQFVGEAELYKQRAHQYGVEDIDDIPDDIQSAVMRQLDELVETPEYRAWAAKTEQVATRVQNLVRQYEREWQTAIPGSIRVDQPNEFVPPWLHAAGFQLGEYKQNKTARLTLEESRHAMADFTEFLKSTFFVENTA